MSMCCSSLGMLEGPSLVERPAILDHVFSGSYAPKTILEHG